MRNKCPDRIAHSPGDQGHTAGHLTTGAEVPKGLWLFSAGVLSGTPSKKLVPGAYPVVAQVTETVTTLNGKKKVKTPTTVEAIIPVTIT